LSTKQPSGGSAVQQFLSRFAGSIMAVLSGFDRIVFRGSHRGLAFNHGMELFINRIGVLRKDFGEYARRTTEAMKTASLARCHELGRPYRYLTSSRVSAVTFHQREEGAGGQDAPVGRLTE
jgi:hypothetical protein